MPHFLMPVTLLAVVACFCLLLLRSSKFEFDYALRRKKVERMITVVMEPRCRDTNTWYGVVGGKLGGRIYFDMASDDSFNDGLARLVEEVRKKVQLAREVTNRLSSSGARVSAGGAAAARMSRTRVDVDASRWKPVDPMEA